MERASLPGGRRLQAKVGDGEVGSSSRAGLEDFLRAMSRAVAGDVRRYVTAQLAERGRTFESLTDDDQDALVEEACVAAREGHWSEQAAEPHVISSKPRDVWGGKSH